jgi:hypothetical protein
MCKQGIELGLIHIPAPLLLVDQHAELVGAFAAEPHESATVDMQLARFEGGPNSITNLIELRIEAFEDGRHGGPSLVWCVNDGATRLNVSG